MTWSQMLYFASVIQLSHVHIGMFPQLERVGKHLAADFAVMSFSATRDLVGAGEMILEVVPLHERLITVRAGKVSGVIMHEEVFLQRKGLSEGLVAYLALVKRL